MEIAGAFCFGLVIGWVTYRTLRRMPESVQLSDIASVLGAVGGAAVTQLFGDKSLFAGYCIGLAVGFFLYFIVGVLVDRKEDAKESVGDWMGGR